MEEPRHHEYSNMVGALCALPNELIISIIEFIEDYNSLRALACVSSTYRTFAEARLYKSILLRDDFGSKTESHLHCTKLFQSLQKEPQRAAAIQSLTLVPLHTPSALTQDDVLQVYCPLLGSCTNLSNLYVESPICNEGHWMVKDSFWFHLEKIILGGLGHLLPLNRLTKLTLHLNGYRQEYWDPNFLEIDHRTMAHNGAPSWGEVMALSSLVELTISCALINDDFRPAPRRSTNLKKLYLIECSVTMQGLTKVLAGPKALEVLQLGENSFNDWVVPSQAYNNLFNCDSRRFIEALAQQAHSLAELEYITGDMDEPNNDVNHTFGDFNQLRKVTLSEHVRDDCCELLLMTAPALEHVSLNIPSEKVFAHILRLEEDLGLSFGKVGDDLVRRELSGQVANALFSELPEKHLKLLKELHIIMPRGPTHVTGSRQTWIQMLADYWKQRGVDLYLYYHYRTGICPPILFDEHDKEPKDVLLFSTQGGFESMGTAPDRFGVEGAWNMNFEDEDLLYEFDFDAWLHDGGHADVEFEGMDFPELITQWPF